MMGGMSSKKQGGLAAMVLTAAALVAWLLLDPSAPAGHPPTVTATSPASDAPATAPAAGYGSQSPGRSARETSSSVPRPRPGGTTAKTVKTAGPGGIPECAVNTLPPQVDEVLEAIGKGGPFNHPAKDGSRFGNYENNLPRKARNYYREYTVDTPGVSSRGARRIVTGGGTDTNPDVYYYTSDHYDSFCLVTGAGFGG